MSPQRKHTGAGGVAGVAVGRLEAKSGPRVNSFRACLSSQAKKDIPRRSMGLPYIVPGGLSGAAVRTGSPISRVCSMGCTMFLEQKPAIPNPDHPMYSMYVHVALWSEANCRRLGTTGVRRTQNRGRWGKEGGSRPITHTSKS